MKNIILAAAIIIMSMASAYAGGFMLLHVGQADGNGGAVGCASPTAPNGVVDLSLCSNAYYVALIF